MRGDNEAQERHVGQGEGAWDLVDFVLEVNVPKILGEYICQGSHVVISDKSFPLGSEELR